MGELGKHAYFARTTRLFWWAPSGLCSTDSVIGGAPLALPLNFPLCSLLESKISTPEPLLSNNSSNYPLKDVRVHKAGIPFRCPGVRV